MTTRDPIRIGIFLAGYFPAEQDTESALQAIERRAEYIEDLGFVEKGKGGVASLEGETAITGRIPVNTSGGLLAKGHPIGATGVAQIVECWMQLRGQAHERQVEIRNGFALQHNVGGRGSGVSVINILTTNR